ncbi:MAG: bifunctional phosphopantothenoylcysteine decarboxylase/phosphopantothenate--cysteine ligase CoaBC [Anaerolineaceae bacterium]
MSNPFFEKHIVLGVTGSVAAYKAVELASKMTQAGALVDVILTPGALHFVSALQFQSVTGRKAYTDSDLWGGEAHVVHVNLGHTADLLVIAPVTASTMAKLANGLGDNLLCVSALAAGCPMLLAPAMDLGMYQNPATQKNVATLKERGVYFIGPAEGHLASGLTGPGRFEEPANILAYIRYLLSRKGSLQGKHIVVSAGGTQEPIDPVRLLSNRSSGKQGFAIAQAALDFGAEVTLITAPTSLVAPSGAKVVQVQTAAQMLDAVLLHCQKADVLIMAAAVADFTPAKMAENKIKKDRGAFSLELAPTLDILLGVAKQKATTGYPRFTVGFAAESENLLQNAASKMSKKKLDLIVANDISQKGSGFEGENNQVAFLNKDGSQESLPLLSKLEVADLIMQKIKIWLD